MKGGGGAKRNKKQYYKQQFQASKRHEEIKRGGISGFLVTCDPSKEQRCIKEVFNVLNEWVERLYPELDIDSLLKNAKVPEEEEPKGTERID
jgi:hypothetical protein